MSIDNNYTLRNFKFLPVAEKGIILLYVITFASSVLHFLMPVMHSIGLSSINPYLSTIFIIVSVLFSIRIFLTRLCIWDYLFVIVIGAFCFFSPYLYPKTTVAVLLYAPIFVFSCLPFYLVGATIDLKKYINTFSDIGRIGVVVNSFWSFVNLAGLKSTSADMDEESMGLAYGLLPSLLFVVWSEIRSHNRVDLFLALIGSFLLLALGTRGPVLAETLFIGGYLFLFKQYKHSIITRIVILLVITFVCIFFEDIVLSLSDVTENLGLSTRVYESLLGEGQNAGGIINTDSRDWIFETVIKKIQNNKGGLGYGFFADRTFLTVGEHVYYAHNFFLEVWLNFGVYIGSLLLSLLVGLFVRNFYKTWGSDYCSLLFCFFCGCFAPLFFSGSYLTWLPFWLFLGLNVAMFRKPKNYFLNK